ncbi:hypothetical protein [Vibrio sp. CyArs1]|uniref:hypothetical protein n=1 Tax=Vibrio sp. CyArs1 TaxID=2682577 RepID=UPI001F06CD61|nr:hypothetical protein [Vibrio sp. CyArs1]
MNVSVERHKDIIGDSLEEFGFTEVQRGSDNSNLFIIGKLKYVNICISCNLTSKSYECDILANKGYHNLVLDIPTMVFSIDAPLEVNVLGAIRMAHIQERALAKYVQTRTKFSAINQLKRLKEQKQKG